MANLPALALVVPAAVPVLVMLLLSCSVAMTISGTVPVAAEAYALSLKTVISTPGDTSAIL